MIFALDTYLVLLSVVIGYQFFEDSYHFYDSGALLLTAVSMLISHHAPPATDDQHLRQRKTPPTAEPSASVDKGKETSPAPLNTSSALFF